MNPPTQYCLPKPFVLSLPFDRLRANGSGPIMVSLSNHRLRVNGFLSFTEEGRKNLIFSVYTIMDRLIYLSL